MLRALLAAVLLLVAVARMDAQSAIVVGPNDALSFDYLDADFSTWQVTGFQVSWDGSATWVALGTTAFRDSLTRAGGTSYKFIPSFTSGQHTVSVRACNAQGCGGGSSPFLFAYGSVPSAVPSNLRKVPR
jgi:hypothetical protein